MASRKGNRKSNRKSRRSRVYSGGMAPVNWSNPGPMHQNLAAGVDFAKYHVGQHGGMAPYPGGVVGSMLPGNLADAARVSSTLNAYKEIAGMQDGGRKRRGSRKSRRSRKQCGGVLVPWGGRRRHSGKSRKSRKSRKSHRRHRMRGGAGINLAADSPMMVPESSKMLIPNSMLQQAGLHKEWADAANPNAFTPKH